MGRTAQSWRIIDHEFAKLNKFRQLLRAEDQMIFEDILNECKLYVHHKRITELEIRMKEELK